MKLSSSVACLAALAALLGATGAQAGITFFNSEAAFLAATGGLKTDTYGDLAAGTVIDGSLQRPGYQVSAQDGLENELYATGTGLSTNRPDATLEFGGFASDLRALGGQWLATTYTGDAWTGARLNLDFSDANGSHQQVLDLASSSGFFGWLSDTVLQSLQVSVYDSNLTVFPTVQSFSLGYAAGDAPAGPTTGGSVPEPAAQLLVLAGLGGLALAQRHRKPLR
ncbi:PEP-CTERM sorting domain-containing protein [Roseateles saccharophilus]|uniref:Putative secreted protein n=1 Tax=Roseateles saccharophilus TaxID=304 RepID=A0A4R3VEE7_ROSSA|nr:PEP-CTERM sorting domain-containing protein [Roseateles saccharophilus]MDG0833000.1 PEP-CTERM sorting domain-containing protein [Roseateles saccharophilus]TCV02092.1 putative secreted protein [Roseateles saccharophilus]